MRDIERIGGQGEGRGIDLAELPMLDMRVGLYGSPRHAEVGGGVCFGMVITMAVYVSTSKH